MPTPPFPNRLRSFAAAVPPRSASLRACTLTWIALLTIGVVNLLTQSAVAQSLEFVPSLGSASSSAIASESITMGSDTAVRWSEGPTDVWVLHGSSQIRQGLNYHRGSEAVVWVEKPTSDVNPITRLVVYLEANDSPGRGARLIELQATHLPDIRMRHVQENPLQPPAIYARAMAHRYPAQDHVVRRTPNADAAVASENPDPPPPPGARRLRAFPRSEVRVQAKWFPNPDGGGWIATISGGVTLIVDGVDEAGSIDISTDRVVIWTGGLDEPDLSGQTLQSPETPLEFYLEGNIEFRQGERIVYANRMYYDVRNDVGIVLEAEMLTPVPEYEGILRVRAAALRQVAKDQFLAYGAQITSSRLGVPAYWLQSDTLFIQDARGGFDPLNDGAPIDPITGQPTVSSERRATASGNFVYLRGIPVFYWPQFSTNLERPTFYLNRVRIHNDNIFGTQIRSDWDAYQVFGIDRPIPGTEWDFSLDYLSDRGLGVGTNFQYDRESLAGLYGHSHGFADFWGISEQGLDNLGADRRALVPEDDFRGRGLWQHRQRWGDGYQFTAELGWISDRNFLEQYFEREWDTQKDQTTGAELKRIIDNRSWSLSADARINEFFTETSWLPRFDHFTLGQSFLHDSFTWFEHSHAGYAKLKTATTPLDPADAAKFDPLAWEVAQEGERIATRQEIDLPLTVGAVKVVPYALGELAHWGSDINGDEMQRAYGQLGIRASVPFWAVDPMIQSRLFNVNGIAHKVVFESELSYSDANRDMTQFPLYDSLDDNAQEHFRRRYFFDTFGGVQPVPAGVPGLPGLPSNTPLPFDERFYALRYGMGGWVTSPVTEIADDLMASRLGVHQRWQTKRGAPGMERIIDWIELDSNLTIFPKDGRDNFDQLIGLVDYDFRWHVGDRVTLFSSGVFDFFDDGQRLVSMGARFSRPEMANLYLGFNSLEGPISDQVLLARLSYLMSPKWIAGFGASMSLNNDGNVGSQMTVTRLGESFLVTVGVNYNESKDNVGAKVSIEPRFLQRKKRDKINGIYVAPAGSRGLE